MKIINRAGKAALPAIVLALAMAGCKPLDPETGKAAGADAADDSASVLKIPGLRTEKQQAGYAIGLELGNTLGPVKDEIDLDAMFQAVRDTVAGKEPKINEEQFALIMQGLATRMQARQAADAEQVQAHAAELAEQGRKFLEENAEREGVKVTASGLQYEVLEQGEGDPPGPHDRVSVHYEGKLADGSVFDSSIARGQPAVFAVDQVVPGWQEGLQLMAPGSRYRLWLPPELAYGAEGTPGGPIGPDAMLAFEVQLLEVLPAGQ